ncbi:MAG TPA: 3-dehydroquinate synthase family protein [Candidatus Tyrphobacter sp.]
MIGEDVRENVVAALRAHGRAYAILCDANPRVTALAGDIARRAGGALAVLPFTLGEGRKRLATVERVMEALAAADADRTTIVVGVGGGIACDVFGFAAATYMRGVAYLHVATSLVAMADAAIGGKTGVDLRAGKNLVGTFRDPMGVFAHVRALRTLPFRCLREGLAEIVKAAIVEGGDLFASIEILAPHPFVQWPWAEVVAAAVNVKTAIVADDREESGMRELLNLGHTFAHAFERASDYRITHGAAVALGLRAAGLLALRLQRFSRKEHLRVLALLTLLQMPLRTSLDPESVMRAMGSDKKRRGSRLRFVLPRAIGEVEYGVEAPRGAVLAVLRRMQQRPA